MRKKRGSGNPRLSPVRRSVPAVGIVVLVVVIVVIVVVIIILLVVLVAVVSTATASTAPARCLLLLGRRGVVAGICVVILCIVVCVGVSGAVAPGLFLVALGDDMLH